jgi:GxxExxY protein
MEIHRKLGPRLLESAYEEALAYELTHANLAFERQRARPLISESVKLECGYRLDFIVGGELVVELKAVSALPPVHHAQLLTHLKLERRSLGLLINFNEPVPKDGVKRIVYGELFKNEELTC